MTFNCFPENFIALRGDCSTYTTIGSGLYINDLHQLSMRTIAKTSDEEQQTALALYRIAHAEGIAQFSDDFIAAMSEDFNYKNIFRQNRQGRLAESFTAIKGATRIGKKITREDCRDPFQCLYIDYIEFYSETVETDFEFVINDNDCNSRTITVDLVCGYNRIPVDYETANQSITITYNGALVNAIDTVKTCSSCGCLACDCDDTNPYGYSTGVTIEDIEDDGAGGAYVDSDIENGLIVSLSVRCSQSALVCMFKSEAARAIRLAIGIYLLRERVFSARANNVVRMSQEDAEELLILWAGGTSKISGFTHKGEYFKQIDKIVNQAKHYLNMQKGVTKCVTCVSNRVVHILPS